MGNDDEGMLLGRHTPVVNEYAPQLLYPIARATARKTLGLTEALPFHGCDIWHAYEMSWLDDCGKPVVRVGRFSVPASSPDIVESKSFKLYLNSLNSTCFTSAEEAHSTIVGDIGATVGAQVGLQLLVVDDPALAGTALSGECLDELPATTSGEHSPGASALSYEHATVVEERLYSHLMRSLCPVTGQPDWATVWLCYRGGAIDKASLLQYILSFREHHEFHEQCVERMFCDIWRHCAPQQLTIQAFYTRRGGLDINPLRSSDRSACAQGRLDRQ